MRFARAAFVLTALLAACAEGGPAPTSSVDGPSLSVQGGQVKDRYIVVFKPGTANADRLTDDLSRGGSVIHRYRTALQGFALEIPAAAVEGIRRNPNVAYVEADAELFAIGTTQSSATWGLDRIDQRALPLSTTYSYDATGAGVHAYILDTGILATHVELAGRVDTGFSAISGGTSDCNGHGTHVSGTVGGTTYGVAKGVTLVPVRVLGCNGSGTTSGVIAGIDWVAANASKPAVANMSLGGGASASLDAAVAGAVTAGVTFVVAAGNDNADACNQSPARAPSAVTVGSTTNTDARSSFSNFGSCLDIFAPGSGITSSWWTSNTATNTISGTSMASPHVAGAAALLLQGTPGASPATITAALLANATTDVVGNPGTNSPNLLLFTPSTGTPPPPPPPPPPPATVETHVSALSGSVSVKGKNWSATAVTTVRDASNGLVSGATVSGRWDGGSIVTCVTSAAGTCSTGSPNFKSNSGSTTWAVTGLSGTNMTYNAAANLQTSITITKP